MPHIHQAARRSAGIIRRCAAPAPRSTAKRTVGKSCHIASISIDLHIAAWRETTFSLCSADRRIVSHHSGVNQASSSSVLVVGHRLPRLYGRAFFEDTAHCALLYASARTPFHMLKINARPHTQFSPCTRAPSSYPIFHPCFPKHLRAPGQGLSLCLRCVSVMITPAYHRADVNVHTANNILLYSCLRLR